MAVLCSLSASGLFPCQQLPGGFRRPQSRPFPCPGNSLAPTSLKSICTIPNFASGSTLPSFRFTAHQTRATSTTSENALETEISVPILSINEVMEALHQREYNRSMTFEAMYSSVVGGITKDVGAMVVPLDDHMVHRGHAVFDTALIKNGFIYELEPHLDRLLRSASAAKISPPFDRNQLKGIITQTAKASNVQDGYIRYWLSAGTGGFSLSTKECVNSTFYVIILGKTSSQSNVPIGVKVITSTVPIKPQEFATVKSVNYLPNALVLKQAEENDAFCGIWLDEDGFVGEGPSMNVAFVTKDDVLLVPEFDRILAGCTIKRVIDLAQSKLLGSDTVSVLKGIEIRRVTVKEAKASKEMLLMGSGVQVESVTDWDGQIFSQGKPGPVAIALRELLEEDMVASSFPFRIPIQ